MKSCEFSAGRVCGIGPALLQSPDDSLAVTDALDSDCGPTGLRFVRFCSGCAPEEYGSHSPGDGDFHRHYGLRTLRLGRLPAIEILDRTAADPLRRADRRGSDGGEIDRHARPRN